MAIAENIKQLQLELPLEVTLVAVSKTKPLEALEQAYNAGQRDFGENKIQEMTQKFEVLPKDIRWHMIGHVQTNKVKYMASFVHLIHGVDSLKLLQEINKQALKHQRIISCLLQVHIAKEETKFGFSEAEILQVIHSEEFAALKNIKIEGLMGMASFTSNKTEVINEFTNLKNIFDYLKPYQTFNCNFKILSMGMSGDYQEAISCGSTMVRIGSSIFGERNYTKNQ